MIISVNQFCWNERHWNFEKCCIKVGGEREGNRRVYCILIINNEWNMIMDIYINKRECLECKGVAPSILVWPGIWALQFAANPTSQYLKTPSYTNSISIYEGTKTQKESTTTTISTALSDLANLCSIGWLGKSQTLLL